MRKHLSFEFKLSIMAIGAIALLCVALQTYFQDYQKVSKDIDSLNDIYQRSSLLNQTLITVQQAEFSQQSYLVHKTEDSLSSFYESSFKLPILANKIQQSYNTTPDQSSNVETLRNLIKEEVRTLKENLKIVQESPANIQSVLQKSSLSLSTKITEVVNAMLSNENLLLQEVQNLHTLRSQLQIKLYLAGSVIVLAIIAICMSLIIKEVRENRKLAQQLEHNATHDFLTGLPNRSFFVQSLKHTLARAKREETLAALFFLDLNGFKHINDTYGHEIGDLVLIRVAEKLRNTMRATDILSRLGGDEFIILAPKLNEASEINIITAKIEEAMRDLPLPFLKEQTLSTSIGHVLIPTDGDNPDLLLAKADSNMYAHKQSMKKPKSTASVSRLKVVTTSKS